MRNDLGDKDRNELLKTWMGQHRKAHLEDAATKQYDSAVESAKQFGCASLKEAFTEAEKNVADSMAARKMMVRCAFRMLMWCHRQILGTYCAKNNRLNMRQVL